LSLSKVYTLKKFWRQGVGDLKIPDNSQLWNERLELIDRAVQTPAGLFYNLMTSSYMTDVTVVSDVTGKWEAGSSSTFTLTTKLITMTTPNANIVSTDSGKMVTFRDTTNVYVGKIETVLTTSTFTITGDSLPSADSTIYGLQIAGTDLVANTISLANLSIMRTGEQTRLELASTATRTVVTKKTEELNTFITTASQNRSSIWWALSGDNLKLVKGADLADYGTMVLSYPRVPYTKALDTDYIDLPDGLPIEISISYLNWLLQKRSIENPKEENYLQKMGSLIEGLNSVWGGNMNQNIIKEKAIALI
jgi:hypothetical protein